MALFSPNAFHFDAVAKHLDPDHHWRRNSGHSTAMQPKFDICETADAYELSGELPGMKKGDIDIELTEPRTVHISGRFEASFTTGTEDEPKTSDDKREASREARNGTEEREAADKPKYWLQERHTGEFSRVFNFPAQLDKHRISATMEGGVLRMVIPKSSSCETHKVHIK